MLSSDDWPKPSRVQISQLKTSRQGVRLVPVGYVNEDRSHGLVSFELSSDDCSISLERGVLSDGFALFPIL